MVANPGQAPGEVYWGSNFKGEFGLKWLTDWPSGKLASYLNPALQPLWVPCVSVLVYVIVIFSLQKWMQNRKRIETPALLAAHNFLLCGISVFLAVGGAMSALSIQQGFSAYEAYCGVSDEVDGPLLNWGNYFYISKYYELLDTVFLVLRKRELTVLHLFHHIIVVFTCWFAVHEHIVMGWITCVNNATIHIFMYWYFGWAALGHRASWRKYLTRFQMIQFVIDIATSIPFLYLWISGANCRGSIWSWLNAVVVGFFLWLLFNNFFHKTYTTTPTSQLPAGATAAARHAASSSPTKRPSKSKKDE